jgi:hypothetical protein
LAEWYWLFLETVEMGTVEVSTGYYIARSTVKKKKVKLSLCLIKHYAMKAYGGVDV